MVHGFPRPGVQPTVAVVHAPENHPVNVLPVFHHGAHGIAMDCGLFLQDPGRASSGIGVRVFILGPGFRTPVTRPRDDIDVRLGQRGPHADGRELTDRFGDPFTGVYAEFEV
jgi:hypothetical protein